MRAGAPRTSGRPPSAAAPGPRAPAAATGGRARRPASRGALRPFLPAHLIFTAGSRKTTRSDRLVRGGRGGGRGSELVPGLREASHRLVEREGDDAPAPLELPHERALLELRERVRDVEVDLAAVGRPDPGPCVVSQLGRRASS